MSLIGPRPDPPDWLDKYPEDIKIFLTVKPGLAITLEHMVYVKLFQKPFCLSGV